MKLVVEVEIQTYSDPDPDLILRQIGDTLTRVVSLCDLSVGTFVTTRLEGENE